MKRCLFCGAFSALLLFTAGTGFAGTFLNVISEDGSVSRQTSLPGGLTSERREQLCKIWEEPFPRFLSEEEEVSRETFSFRCTDQRHVFAPLRKVAGLPTTVRTIVNQGPVGNRIDLTVIGDGYTRSEEKRFFADVERMAHDLFQGDTFSTYLPLFNVHAVFVASPESGIGDGAPKNTALRLYRHPTVRQAIMPGDPSAANAYARKAPDTDYPILMANDPYYGGLGGEFAITSNSLRNITTVLRHELGHNFGRVGEEYDGGQVYSGANFSRSPDVSWHDWLGNPREPAWTAKLIHYSAPWKLLNGDLLEIPVAQPPPSHRFLLDFSSMGFDRSTDVELRLDNQPVPYSGEFNPDRNFYQVSANLTPGSHQIAFIDRSRDGNNVISKVAAYALPEGFPLHSRRVGKFGTYSSSGFIGYRPTESLCLMREMKSTRFCPVCIENMWEQLLSRLRLIDTLSASHDRVELKTIPLGARLSIHWFQGMRERIDLEGRTSWIPLPTDRGRWRIEVRFTTPEVRRSNQGWAVDETTFTI